MKRGPFMRARWMLSMALAVALLPGMFVIWRASRALHTAAQQVHDERLVRFVVRPLAPQPNSDFEPIPSSQTFFQAARFHDDLYLAGPSGLLDLAPDGTARHEFLVGRELPGSPLLAIATGLLSDAHQPELILATADQGVLAFDGRGFRQIFPYDSDFRAITALCSDPSGHLILGTRKHGVILYDGKQITTLHPALSSLHVTALVGSEPDLWVGTLDHGVLHFHAGQADSFSEAQGLPDPQVQSLALAGDTTYVGTPLGVAVFTAGRFSHVLAPGVLATALLATPDTLYVGSVDQGVVAIPLASRHPHSDALPDPRLAEVRQLFASGDKVYALARSGLYERNARASSWRQILRPAEATLSDRNISALAADAAGRLWLGYFDRGLDLLSPEHARAIHVEDEHVFCVNRIVLDPRNGIIQVATANGLVRFNEAGSEQQVLTRADGLIADHVTDVVAYRDGLALATPAGLTFLEADGARSLYAFHGLVNNHVYALGVSGDELLAGTLGGISVLDKGNVAENFTTATSNLNHNWITAVVPVGSQWMVGTYGGGILGLDRVGRFHSFEKASGPFEVNPNAMLVTANYVLAGTLGNGLFLYDRQAERWSVITAGLPSSNVTALAAGNGYIYIGTDNGLVRIPEQKLHS